MISLIVSSYNPKLFDDLKQTVAATIGVPYEIVKVDNAGIMGICEAYNIGAAKAKFAYLCFVHEDVIFKTINWGDHIINALNTPNVGVIGIAGGSYKSQIPGPAWHNGDRYVNVLYPKYGQVTLWNERGRQQGSLVDVVVVDGVFLCCKKTVWAACKFDEDTLKGFHFYDMDFSLAVLMKKMRVCVTYDILLDHLSAGSNNADWYNESLIAHKKWKSHLPVMSQNHTRAETLEFDYVMAELDFTNSLEFNAGYGKKISTAIKVLQLKPFHISSYKWLLKVLIFRK